MDFVLIFGSDDVLHNKNTPDILHIPEYVRRIFSVVIFNKKELQIITNLQKDWKLIKIVKWNSSFKGLQFCVHFWLISETYKMNDLGLIFTSENEQEN